MIALPVELRRAMGVGVTEQEINGMCTRHLLMLLAGLFLVLSQPYQLLADTLLLASGGRVEGEWLNRHQVPRTSYVLKTANGRVELTVDQVERVVGGSEAEQRYLRLLPQMPNSADGHWKMADWCRKRALSTLRRFHLRKVLTFDPDHAQARRGLGYARSKEGHWIETREWMTNQGYLYHGGKWKTLQQTQLEDARREAELAEKEWIRRVKKWRSWIGGRKQDEAVKLFQEITDSDAAVALADVLSDDSNVNMRVVYVRLLGQLESPVGTRALMDAALNDKSEAVRDECLKELQTDGSSYVVRTFVRALSSADNTTVNRAAMALGRLKAPIATLPLIQALITEHKVTVRSGSGINPVFGRGSGGTAGGLSVGGGKPKVIRQKVHNPEVLTSLLLLSDGADFQFDQVRWKSWYVDRHRPPQVNLRRESG